MTRSLYADDGEAPPVTFCVRNVLGAPVAGVSVTVNTGGAKAAIFADPGLTAAQANPLTSDGHGNCLYYAPPGTYSHVLSGAVLPVEDVTVIGGGGLSAAEARATYVASADGINFTWGGNPVSLGSGGGATIAVSDESGEITGAAASLNFVGGAVAATDDGSGNVTVTVDAATVVESVDAVAASGAAQTIPDPATATISRIVLTANCTLTFPTAEAGASFTLVLVQDATGGRAVTWPAVKWASGTAPTLSSAAGKVDTLSFLCADGSTWMGFVAGLDMH